MRSGCTACAPTAGPSDQTTRNFGCWWTREVLGLAGRPARGFGLGAQTTDTNLYNAALAVLNLNDPCDLTASGATVAAFQTAWNATTDDAMKNSTNSQNSSNWPMTVDGKYGPNSSDAVAAALDTQSATGCTAYTGSYGGGGGTTSYSAAVTAAATALDSYLATSGCTSCAAAGQPPNLSDPLSALVIAFKNAILVTPGNTSTASPTVTGSTINMSTQACQAAYGPGSISDLTAVLGSAKKSTVQCTDSSCNCLQGGGTTPPSPGPSPSPTPPSPVTPPSSPSSSSSSSSGAVIALVAGAAVGGGLLLAKKKGLFRKHHG